MKARLGRVFLVLALLIAQQAALAHQVWHAAAGAPHAAGTQAGKEPLGNPPQERLCDLHSALGTVLGALAGTAVPLFVAVLPETDFAAPPLQAASLAAPAPASRDPPVSL